MPKRPLAALCALLTFAAVLTVVPLVVAAPEPAAAAEAPSCPAGQHSNGGAGKNCHANHDYSNIPCGTGTWSPGHGHSSVSRPACKPPPSCPSGQHSNGGAGKNCHANHDYSNIPCGTGTWSPGHGHSSVSRPACKNGSDGHPGGTDDEDSDDDTATSTDPCETWASSTRDALKTANPDGTYNISPAPSGCGTTTQELLGKARVAGVNISREMEQIFKDWTEATEGVAKLNDEERDKAWAEYQKAWTGVPQPLRSAAIGAACYAIIPATKGKTLKQGALASACSAALGIDLTIPDLPPDDDSDDDAGGGHPGGTDADSEPTPDPNDPDGDYNGDGKTTRDELGKANQKHWDEEITDEEYERIVYKFFCDSGDSDYCGK